MVGHKLTQQVVLITGASGGIGAAAAQILSQRHPGVSLVLAARRLPALEQVAVQCQAAGARVLVMPTDMADLDQVKALAAKALDHFGRVDALVNNAGYGQMGPLELVPPGQVQQQFAVNFFGPVALVQALVPSMRDHGGGRIVNISSVVGRLALPFASLYSASKFALEGLSDSLRIELAPFNIRVCLVEPGPVATEFFTVAAQRLEQAIPDLSVTPYRGAGTRLKSIDGRKGAWPAERVAQVILQALEDPRPRSRYPALTGGFLTLGLLTRVLPVAVVDSLLGRFYGVDQVAEDWVHGR